MVSWLIKRDWKYRCWFISLCCALMIPTAPASASNALPSPYPLVGDYGGEIREKKPRADGLVHVDTEQTIRRLKELHVNTYFYLVWHEKSDWDDLRKEFLPAAHRAGIHVWVYLVPPSEAQLQRSEPFGTDYIAWFRAVGRLSRHFPNLKGIVMDDFDNNASFFTPHYLKKAREAGLSENPQLRFYPQIYYPSLTPALLKQYHALFDGVVMSFRDDHYRNTQKIDRMIEQLDEVQSVLERVRLPFILMIYASRLSATPANPSVHYVEGALKLALTRLKLRRLDGVVTYVLQKEFHQEEDDCIAKSGYGYANLFAPAIPADESSAGHYVEWRQRIFVQPHNQAKLAFWHISVYPPYVVQGTYVKQVLIDNQVVWQSKITQHEANRWVPVTLDLTRVLRNKRQAILSLRLTKTKAGPAYWTYSGFDHLAATGFQLHNADFEYKGHDWNLISSTRHLLGEILLYDPGRRYRTFQAVRKLYQSYHLYEQLARWAEHPLLIRKADRLLTCILLDQTPLARDLLEEMPSLVLFDRHIPYQTKEKLIRDTHQLYHLLNE
ncbi:hypothetical protein [Laceyella putida]|uniref:Glycosyl hydrolase-like 10 domain-containing protein n=1 Tax=Laceyella putida TaxID=110101 RepID=A0ABW2RI38_9BACL